MNGKRMQRVVGGVVAIAAIIAIVFCAKCQYETYRKNHPVADKKTHSTAPSSKQRIEITAPFEKICQSISEHLPKKVSNLHTSCNSREKLQKMAQKHQVIFEQKLGNGHEIDWLGENAKQFDIDDERLYKHNGPVLIIGKMKTMERIDQKVANDYNGDYSRICDAVRGTIVVDYAEDISDVVDKLGGILNLCSAKNRMLNRSPSGYSDVLVNFKEDDGFIGEMQITTKSLFFAKNNGGHELYKKQREIEAKYDTGTPREEYGEDDRREIEDLIKQQRKLYDKAFEKSFRNGEKK